MIDDEKFCQVQGHEGQKLSHICVFIDCLNASRWLCLQCVRKQTHIHKDGINGFSNLRTTMEFMRDFKIKIQPLLELKINSLEGIQVKYNYLQKIHKDLANLDYLQFLSEQSHSQLKQEQIDNDLEKLNRAFNTLINLYQNEMLIIQKIKEKYYQLNNFGLRSLTNNEINILLKINSSFLKEENQWFQRINFIIRKIDDFIQNNRIEHSEFEIKIIQDANYRIQFLREYINYYEDQTFVIEENIDFDNIFLSENERYLAFLNLKDQINIRDLNSKKLNKSYNLRNQTQLICFDDEQRYLVIFDNQYNLCYYILQGNNKSIKLIKKQYIGYYVVRRLILISINKIIMICQNQIEILNFRNKSVNQISLYDYDSTDIELVFYARIKGLIVITIKINDNQNILIYQENKQQPFIQQNVNIEQTIQINQISLARNDTLLFTEDQYEIKLWQIEFQDKKLTLINRVLMDKYDDYWFSYSLSDYNIKTYGYSIQIQDINFNVLYEITAKDIADKYLFSQKFIFLMVYGIIYQNRIQILRKARTDYHKLL